MCNHNHDNTITRPESCNRQCAESERYSNARFWTLTISLIFLSTVIICGIIYMIFNFKELTADVIYNTFLSLDNNQISGSVELNNETMSPFGVLIFYAIIVIAIAFNLYKIIAVLRDLIENEQYNSRRRG